MALITPERLVALKAAVKAECQRRKYTGSVSSYGGTSYDFSVTPASGKMIKKEHYEKLAVPLNAITGTFETDGAKIVSDADIAAMEAKVAELAKKSTTTSKANSGCAASCTGLCTTSCSTSCSGSCEGDCDGTCDGGCTGDCDGGCYGCSGSCTGGCELNCADNCVGYCESDAPCQGSCVADCAQNCYHICYSDCTGSANI